MSEQLASDIEAKENGRMNEGPKSMSDEELAKLLNEDTSDDLVIAQMLQMQFDKEYDQALGVEETHKNGGSKVTVSLSKYKLVPENPIWDDSDDDDKHWLLTSIWTRKKDTLIVMKLLKKNLAHNYQDVAIKR